jgi:signal transduction histidine kinase
VTWLRRLPRIEAGIALVLGALGYGLLQAQAAGQRGAAAVIVLAAFGLGAVSGGSKPDRWADIRSLLAGAIGIAVASLSAVDHYFPALWQSFLLVPVFGAGRAARSVAEARRFAQVAAESAVAEERARIARDLHDLVAHSLGVVVVQIQAAEHVMGTDPAKARAALRAAAAVGRDALDDMHRMVGVMRGAESTRAAQPGLADLPALVEQSRQSELSVTLLLEGEPDGVDGVLLPPGLQLAAYRIVQEALTNAARYAAGGSAEVRLKRRKDGLEIEIVDNGGSVRADTGGGFGIAGMRERASLYGGTVDAGPVAEGGFRVRAWLPARHA